MAIVKMKKLRLMVVRSRKDELLKELVRCGCVEFSELGGVLQDELSQGLVKRESSKLMSLKAQHAVLNNAVALLNKYAPVKGKLLSAKPEVEDEVLIDSSTVAPVMEIAESIVADDERIKRLSAEESRQRGVIESLVPWLGLDMPLETTGTQYSRVLMGTVNTRISLNELESSLALVSEEVELFRVFEDKSQNYILVICAADVLSGVQETLRAVGFSASALSGLNGTARECTANAEKALAELAAEKESTAEAIRAEACHMDELKLACDKVHTAIAVAEAEDMLCGMDSVVVMQGWMPAERETELAAIFEKLDCAWETEDPDPSEYPDVPVKLKNNKVTNALNMVTEMYSLPAYDGVDPNPLMAPFFILFYGMMMADMGYGLLMIVAALVALKKIKPRRGSLAFCQLLLYGGISTFIMGIVTGGFFGDALARVGQIIGMPAGWGELPCLFNPMTDSMFVLILSMALGLVHLNAGLAINAVIKVKSGDIAGMIWEEGALWVTMIGAALAVLKIGNIAGYPVVLIIGVIMIFYGGSRGAKGFGKVTSLFGTLYNTATGWFGDILSYARIMALMLAGSVIATVFNTIGAIANNLVFFLVIFVVGHALNFGLNLLGCYVHDLRLQCLEYFGKFYKDGGRAFAPLEVKSKYYNTIEE